MGVRGDSDGFDRLLGCLLEANRTWAEGAGALVLTALCRTFVRNGKANRMAEHDIGLAVGNFTVQATALGLSVHQMAGIDLEMARATCAIPAPHEPVTALALGYAVDPATVDGPLADRDRALRRRKPMSEFVFTDVWGNAWPGM